MTPEGPVSEKLFTMHFSIGKAVYETEPSLNRARTLHIAYLFIGAIVEKQMYSKHIISGTNNAYMGSLSANTLEHSKGSI